MKCDIKIDGTTMATNTKGINVVNETPKQA
jgi:hypothetical protein